MAAGEADRALAAALALGALVALPLLVKFLRDRRRRAAGSASR
jgi:hypothetical protein